MAQLYLNPDTESVYLDVTAGDRSATSMVAVTDGFVLHLDEARAVVAIEVMDVSRRGGTLKGKFGMGHLHVNPSTDALYLDVSAGSRQPAGMTAVADDVFVHVDAAGALVGIEVMGLSRRGGLHVDDLDAVPGGPRPAVFDDIERAARSHGHAQDEKLSLRGHRPGRNVQRWTGGGGPGWEGEA